MALVKAAHTAIKQADPGAKVVLAGMPNDAWNYLQKIYNVPHAGRYFDVVAVHPYTVIPSNVILFLQKMRAVMKRNGDARKPLVITEMGWNSSIGHKPADDFCCQSTAARQAAKVKAVLPLLAQNRAALKLQAFYYYTWASHGTNGGPSANWAGIFQINGSRLVPKPVYAQFKAGVLAIEHCRRIGRLAGQLRRAGRLSRAGQLQPRPGRLTRPTAQRELNRADFVRTCRTKSARSAAARGDPRSASDEAPAGAGRKAHTDARGERQWMP